MRAAAALWARAELRARWRSLVALGVLAGVVVGLSAAAVAGARRTDTSFERLRARTNAADAIVFPGQVGVYNQDWTALTARPEIAELARWKISFGRVAGAEDEAVFFAPADTTWLNKVDRPVVVEGRMFDPTAPDEVVVGEAATRAGMLPGVRVGSVIRYKPFAAGQDDTSGEPPRGPDVELRVVGVVRQIDEFLFVPGMVMLSPAFVERYAPDTIMVENAMVRLKRGAADMPRLRRSVNDLVAPGTPIDDLHVIQRRVDTTLEVERTALLLLAGAIAVAGLVLVIQALGRSVSIPDDEVLVLQAMGFDRSSIALSVVLVHLIVATVAAVVALSLAVAASRWFPIGLASKIDPDRRFHADWVVLVPAVVISLAFVLGWAAAAGWRLSGSPVSEAPWRQSAIATKVSRMAPLTVGLGVTMAFRRSSERSGDLVRPAIVGAVVGVLGVVAIMTIDRGLNDALANPARAGVTWDASVLPLPADRTETGVAAARLDSIAAVPVVADTAVVRRLVSEVNGTGVPVFSVQSTKGTIVLSSASGRAPAKDDEAAIGPRTARQLGVRIGDTVSVGPRRRPVRIVGEALFPAEVHAGFDEGLWLTPRGFDASQPPVDVNEPRGPSTVAVRFRAGTGLQAAIAEVARRQAGAIAGIVPADVPPELSNLRDVRMLPRILAAFLALLAAAAIAYVLAASVRRRRRDLATMRAMGMTPGGARAVLNMQGTAIAFVGLLLGIPFGMAIGRIGWRLVTARVPLQFVAPLALASMMVLVPAALVLVNLLAVWPGRRAARLRPAEVLRTE
ncbi:MAG: ABC transporter permease [Actinomycetota bacterium]|nr:ABC transporter permease [Actinomycetota bacterium]